MINIIVCISKESRAIGYQNRLLYHIKEDMTRFRVLTTGHTIIMGRKTYESLPNGALPKRRNIVLSQTLSDIPGSEVFPSLPAALSACHEEEVFIIGGASIYQEALPLANKLYLTIVDDEPQDADTFFPQINEKEWKTIEKEMRNENGLPFTFLTLQKC